VPSPEFFLDRHLGPCVVGPLVNIHTQRSRLINHLAGIVDVAVRTDTANMNEAGNPAFLGGVKQIARTVNRDLHEFRPRPPISHASRSMIDTLHAITGSLKRRAIGQVAFDQFHTLLRLQPTPIRTGAHQHTNGPVAFAKLLYNVAAQ